MRVGEIFKFVDVWSVHSDSVWGEVGLKNADRLEESNKRNFI